MSLLTSLFTVGSSTSRSWCRPTHRTNCAYVVGGNACCVCIPATATCFVIEMWGQGGGGAGTCCCMGACFGGQGGDYAWVTCATSNTVHTLCACACSCYCQTTTAGIFTGSPGQSATVKDCDLVGSSIRATYTVAASACGGSTCCNGMIAMDSVAAGQNMTYNQAHSNLAINCCWQGNWTNNPNNTADCYIYCCGYNNLFSIQAQMPFYQIQGTGYAANLGGFVSCSCCQNFNFYVRGGCGWSDPGLLTQFASDNANWYNTPTNTYCGYGFGRGGAAYAGGAGQCNDCGSNSNNYFGGCGGNAPGGGGSSASMAYSPGSCCLGGQGGLSLILISWS